MGAHLLALVQHGNRNLAQPLADLRRILQQLAEANCAGEPGRPRADDQDADLDPVIRRVARRGDVVRGAERRR